MRFVSLSRYGRATLPVLILLAGGAGDDSSGRAGPAADSEVRIGWYGPADADHPLAGGMWGAAELAVEEANAGGGFAGRPFRLVPSWSQNPWGSGIVGVTRMAYDEGVWAIVGAPDGPSAHLVEQVVAKARLTFVSPVATDPTANLANVPWVFSCAPSDDVLAQALAEAIVHDTDRVAVVSCTDHDSRIFTAELLAALQDRKVFPVRHVKFRPGVAGFRTQLEALRIGGAEAHGSADPAAGFDGGTIGQQTPDAEPVPPSARSFESLLPCQGGAEGQAGSLCYPKRRDWEGLVVIAGPEDAARFLITLRQAGFSMPVYGGPRMGHRLFISLAGESAGGLVFSDVVGTARAPVPRRRLSYSGFETGSVLPRTTRPCCHTTQ